MMHESDPALKRLGRKIRDLRKAKRLTQEQLAYDANINRSYIGQVERGERNIAFSNTFKIAKALEVRISDLMENVEDES